MHCGSSVFIIRGWRVKKCGLYPGKEIAFLKKAYRDDEKMQDGGCLTSIAGSSEIIICRYTET